MNDKNKSSEKSEKTLEDFLLDLIDNQEELGEEFSKVLYDNLWDLYES